MNTRKQGLGAAILVMRLFLALCLGAITGVGQEIPSLPAIRFENLPGGKIQVVVEQKPYSLEPSIASTLKAELEALDLPSIRTDISKLRDLVRKAEKADSLAELKAKASERETQRFNQLSAEATSLAKRVTQLEGQVNRALRNKATNVESLRSQLHNTKASLNSTRKELARAKELKDKAANASTLATSETKSASQEVEALRRDLVSRLSNVRTALNKAGI